MAAHKLDRLSSTICAVYFALCSDSADTNLLFALFFHTCLIGLITTPRMQFSFSLSSTRAWPLHIFCELTITKQRLSNNRMTSNILFITK